MRSVVHCTEEIVTHSAIAFTYSSTGVLPIKLSSHVYMDRVLHDSSISTPLSEASASGDPWSLAFVIRFSSVIAIIVQSRCIRLFCFGIAKYGVGIARLSLTLLV